MSISFAFFCLFSLLLPISSTTNLDVEAGEFNCAILPPALWCACEKVQEKCGFTQKCTEYANAVRNQPVHITLLYESLCPDCQQFISNKLYDVYQRFKKYVRIELVPYGNARVAENGTIQCQQVRRNAELTNGRCLVSLFTLGRGGGQFRCILPQISVANPTWDFLFISGKKKWDLPSKLVGYATEIHGYSFHMEMWDLPPKSVATNTPTDSSYHLRTDSFYTRMKIRESWAANLTDENIALKFVVGWPLEAEDIFNLLLDEFTQFDDLIFYDIEDTYANLYLKVFVALQWKQFYCPNAKFVLKTDDDTCLDLRRLRWWIANEFVHRLNQYPASVFMGIWRGTKAIRSPSHRRYVPPSLYPKSKYPPYMNGPTYLMSSQAVSAIFLNFTKIVKAFTIEGILYTGILANIAHVKKFSVWQHFRRKFIYVRVHCLVNKLNGNRPIPFVTAIYGISDPDKLQRIFHRLRNIDCSPWSSMRRMIWTSLDIIPFTNIH